MSLRLSTPPSFYSQSDQSMARAELQREDALNAKNNQDARFNNLVAQKLTVNGVVIFANGVDVTGDSTFHNKLNVVGDFTFTSLVPAAGTFLVSGVTCNRTSLIQALSSQAQNLAFMTPNGASGFPLQRAIVMADLPDYTELGAPDATVTTVANNATANLALGTILNIAANSVSIGDCFRMTCRGVYGDAAAAPTLSLSVISGPGATMCSTGANAVGGVSLVNQPWEVVVDFIVTALGNAIAGKMEVQGHASLSTGATTTQEIGIKNTATVSFNTTIANSLQLVVTWGTANASNTISCRQTIWESLKQ